MENGPLLAPLCPVEMETGNAKHTLTACAILHQPTLFLMVLVPLIHRDEIRPQEKTWTALQF
jgi:hypothetical protein